MIESKPIKLDEYWPYQIVVLADLISKHTISVLKEHGSLNLSQWRVLAAVAEQEGRTSAEVVTVTPMDKGIVSRATASLVEVGILNKVSDKSDRRRAKLFLTDEGRRTYTSVATELKKRNKLAHHSEDINRELLALIDALKA